MNKHIIIVAAAAWAIGAAVWVGPATINLFDRINARYSYVHIDQNGVWQELDYNLTLEDCREARARGQSNETSFEASHTCELI